MNLPCQCAAVPHIRDNLLQRVRKQVEAALFSKDRGALDNVCYRLVSTLWWQRCCHRHVGEAMRVMRDALLGNAELRHPTHNWLREIGFLAILAMEAFSEMARRRNAILIGEWEARAWAATYLMATITPDTPPLLRQTPSAIQFIKQVFLSEELCPSPRLRWEMIRYMQLWPEEELWGFFLGLLPSELAKLMRHLKLQDLLPLGKPSLSGPLLWLLKTCCRLSCLTSMASMCLIQVSQLELTFETFFFCRLVRLLGQQARALRHICFNGAVSRLVVLKEFTHLVESLHVVLSVPSCMCVYKVPGLVQVASNALAATTINLYRCSSMLTATQAKFKKLTETMNSIYNKIRLGNKVLWMDLANRHKATLARAADIASAVGCPLPELSVPPLMEEGLLSFPDHHLDAITGRVMTDPVWVVNSYFGSEIVVDFSTLMAFLLVPRAPVFPSVMPIVPLPELADEITRQRAFFTGAGREFLGHFYVKYQLLPRPNEDGHPLYLTVHDAY